MLATRTSHWKWALPLIVLAVVLDQLTKGIVLSTDVFNARECLNPGATMSCGQIKTPLSFLDWTMLWNYGVSYGMFQSQGIFRWLLALFQISIAGVFCYWLIFISERKRLSTALALVVSGAIGNVIDRIRFGAVVDFVDMSGPWFGIRFPAESGLFAMIDGRFVPDGVLGLGFPYVYNVADMWVTFGALLLLYDQILAERSVKG